MSVCMPDRAKGADMPNKGKKYTELDIGLALLGGERSNLWKKNIHDLLSVIANGIYETICLRNDQRLREGFESVSLGELTDAEGRRLLLCCWWGNFSTIKVVVTPSTPEEIGPNDGFLLLEKTGHHVVSLATSLPLNYVFPVRRALPWLASVISERFPKVDEKVKQLRELGIASLDSSQIG